MAEPHLGRRARAPRADMTCERVTALIRDYLAGELSPEMTVMFEEHLQLCQDCVAFLKTYTRTTQVVASLRYEDIPAEMQTRVRQFLRAKIKGFPRNG